MKKEKLNKSKWLHVRLSVEEFELVNKAFGKTACRRKSDFIRLMLLSKPVVGAVRNASLQEILAELVALRKDFHGVANNFNQLVHKLHTLGHLPQFKSWVLSADLLERKVAADVEIIKEYIAQTAAKWLQS